MKSKTYHEYSYDATSTKPDVIELNGTTLINATCNKVLSAFQEYRITKVKLEYFPSQGLPTPTNDKGTSLVSNQVTPKSPLGLIMFDPNADVLYSSFGGLYAGEFCQVFPLNRKRTWIRRLKLVPELAFKDGNSATTFLKMCPFISCVDKAFPYGYVHLGVLKAGEKTLYPVVEYNIQITAYIQAKRIL